MPLLLPMHSIYSTLCDALLPLLLLSLLLAHLLVVLSAAGRAASAACV
jgi:hypothetical protein